MTGMETTGSKEPGGRHRRSGKRLRRLFSGTNLVITFVASVVTIGLAGLAVWQAWPRQTYTFTVPSPDEITTEPCAFKATVQGKPPVGQIIVVSNQDQEIGDNNDPLLHFGPATQW